MPRWSPILALTVTTTLVTGLAVSAQGKMSRPGETRDDFLMYAARSYSETRSGDLFVFPQRYHFIGGRPYSLDGFSHVRINGQVQRVPNQGIGHGLPWDYDTRIPIVFYGPGFIQEGQTVENFATQQDLAPTLAYLLDTPAPEDTRGRVLSEALKPNPDKRKPKAILTLVFDGGGLQNFYETHPANYPEIKAIMAKGTFFRQAKVTHVDAETSVGHTAIGTGAYPAQHGIVSNSYWRRDFGESVSAFKNELPNSPGGMESPTLMDFWNRATGNKAVNVSYCYADRAALGMAGHGRLFAKDSHNIVVFYDDKTGKLKTNEKYFDFPKYLADLSPDPFWQKATGGTNMWMEHRFDPKTLYKDMLLTSPFARFDAEVFRIILRNEPIGQDDVPDLLYLTLKSTDACAHAFGAESEECGEVFRTQDEEAGIIIRALEEKVGRDNLVVVITADHGGPPLPELHGGFQVRDSKIIEDLNKQFDRLDNGVLLVEDVTASQVFVNDEEMQRNRVTREDLKRYLENYTVGGKKFFFAVFTKDEVRQARARAGLF